MPRSHCLTPLGRVRAAVLPLLASTALALAVWPTPAAAQIRINEIRIDQPSTDNDEYFELKGPASTALTSHHLIVIGDASAAPTCGVIEAVVNLNSFAIQADGFFAASEPTATLTGFDAILAANALNFENDDNVTFYLVTGFTGTNGQDLDTNDDGTLDVTPWTTIVDQVALIESQTIDCTSTERYYSATTVGPDAGNTPHHVHRCGGGNTWQIAASDVGINDTPGAANNCTVPPNIQDEFRTPCVPLVNGTASVVVDVLYATSVDLHWMVNGGTETVVAMTLTATVGDLKTFRANIPGQTIGARVEYFVIATNVDGTDQGPAQGYFVGTTPIANLRVNDMNGFNLYGFYGARVRGNVTVAPGVFSNTNTDYYVQDATSGINVFQFGPHPEQPQLGDDITVTGSILQFNGKLEISTGGPCDQLDVVINGAGSPPAPRFVNSCSLGEAFEGMLVKIYHLNLTPADATFGSNVSYQGTNCPPNPASIFIDGDTNIDGTPITSTYVDVVGIVTQFDGSSPYTGPHDITPRSTSDITFLNPAAVGDPTAASGLWLAISPNPFSRSTEVRYRIPGTEPSRVRLQVLDIQGRVVATLVDAVQAPGEHGAKLDRSALSKAGGALHFMRLEHGAEAVTHKLVHLP